MNTTNQTETIERKYRYILTDGFETFRVKGMTETEAHEANLIADQATDNNVAWVKAWNDTEI